MKMKIKLGLILIAGFLFTNSNVFSQDPNFHIYLCLGQSNMEGAARAELQDSTVNPRFQVMEAVKCDNLDRKMGNWYQAVPPLCRCKTNLGPTDYSVSYTHLRAHETRHDLVCRLLLEKKKN